MRKLIMTKGLPASGKSTWAKELLAKEPGKWKRINKDDLRAMLDNGVWSKKNEEFVLQIRDFLIITALIQGLNVIVDDTNLHPKHEKRLRELVAQNNLASHLCTEDMTAVFEVKDFTDVPLEECIERDCLRIAGRVGERVIKNMYNQFIKPQPPKIEYNPKLPDALIVDIDGTLALFGNKNPYDRDFENDELNKPIINILDRYNNYGAIIILVSGRDGKYKEVTEKWLKTKSVPYDFFYMRTADDKRKDVIIKQELYDAHIKGKYNILFVLDDRNQVVEFWRSQGLTCLQVADGAF